MWFLKLWTWIPSKWKLPVALLSLGILVFGSGYSGWKLNNWWNSSKELTRLEKIIKDQKDLYEKELTRQAENEREVIKYVDRVQYIQGKERVVEKEIIKYVVSDSLCESLPGAFRLCHDMSAVSIGSTCAPTVDGSAPRVELATAASTINANYSKCHQMREQILALQAWTCRDGLVKPEDYDKYCR